MWLYCLAQSARGNSNKQIPEEFGFYFRDQTAQSYWCSQNKNHMSFVCAVLTRHNSHNTARQKLTNDEKRKKKIILATVFSFGCALNIMFWQLGNYKQMFPLIVTHKKSLLSISAPLGHTACLRWLCLPPLLQGVRAPQHGQKKTALVVWS